MTFKDYAISIMLHGFFGFMFIILTFHVINFINQLEHTLLIGGVIYVIVFLLFTEGFRRATDFNVSQKHPMNILGKVTFGAVAYYAYFSSYNISNIS